MVGEERAAGRNILILIINGGIPVFGIGFKVVVGHPDEERHVKLIIRRYGRSVEEQMAGIVENILTMIGSVEHGGIYLLFFQSCG